MVGHGEATPIERYEESAQSALAYLEAHADALGDDPFALDEILERLAGAGVRGAVGDRRRAS